MFVFEDGCFETTNHLFAQFNFVVCFTTRTKPFAENSSRLLFLLFVWFFFLHQIRSESTYEISLTQPPQKQHVLELMEHPLQSDDHDTCQNTLQKITKQNSSTFIPNTATKQPFKPYIPNNTNTVRQRLSKHVLKY